MRSGRNVGIECAISDVPYSWYHLATLTGHLHGGRAMDTTTKQVSFFSEGIFGDTSTYSGPASPSPRTLPGELFPFKKVCYFTERSRCTLWFFYLWSPSEVGTPGSLALSLLKVIRNGPCLVLWCQDIARSRS